MIWSLVKFFFFKQKTAYEVYQCDWSSDVCSSDLYIFLLAEALTEAAIREGLPHHAAEKLVLQTIRGAGVLAQTSDKSAFRLRAEVTSPGGTTSAALHVLENSGFRTMIEDAVRAAAQRSRELGGDAASLIPESE